MNAETTLLESIEFLARWFDRESDFPQWMPIETLLRPSGSAPYSSEQELAQIREESRFYANFHPFLLSAIENRVSYTIGTGHQYTVRARPQVEIDSGTLDRVRGEILDFVERNEWYDRQAETRRRIDRDGEAFLRFFESRGRLVVRFVEPEHVAQPVRSDAWYGIETEPQDVETAVAYHVLRNPTRPGDTERVPASQIQHRKEGVDRNSPRGVPLCYPIRANLRRSWKLLRNMSTVASIQAAVAIVRKHSGAKTGTIQQYVANIATAKTTGSDGQEKTYQQYPPGAIVDVPSGVEYEFPASGIDVANYVQALQAELRAIAARLCMPEFMLSADASNANYASTMVAEGPAVKMFERLQTATIWADWRVIQRALVTAERAGRLPEGITDQVEIDAEPPILMSRDRLKEAQADQILHGMGVVSRQSLASRHNLDFQHERDLIDEEEEREFG